MAYQRSLDPLNNHQLHRGTITADDVVTMRQRHAAGLSTVRELADVYGVGPETIRRALRGETWRHLQVRPDPLASPGSIEGMAESLERLVAVSEAKASRPALAAQPTVTAAIDARVAAYTGRPVATATAAVEPERSELDQGELPQGEPPQAATAATAVPTTPAAPPATGALAMPAHYPLDTDATSVTLGAQAS